GATPGNADFTRIMSTTRTHRDPSLWSCSARSGQCTHDQIRPNPAVRRKGCVIRTTSPGSSRPPPGSRRTSTLSDAVSSAPSTCRRRERGSPWQRSPRMPASRTRVNSRTTSSASSASRGGGSGCPQESPSWPQAAPRTPSVSRLASVCGRGACRPEARLAGSESFPSRCRARVCPSRRTLRKTRAANIAFPLRGVNQMATEGTLSRAWDQHLALEFAVKDPDQALATMTANPSVNVVALMVGGRGRAEVREFYAHYFIPQIPADMETIPVSRTIGRDRVVDELVLRFTHSIRMDWLLPRIAPAGKRVEVPMVAIVQFEGDKVAHERLYWDQASMLVQIGLLDRTLPVRGGEIAAQVLNPTQPMNELIRRESNKNR